LLESTVDKEKSYRAFHGFGQAKFLDGGLVLGSRQFSILPQLPPKILLDSKVVKIDPKMIILLRLSKSVTHSLILFGLCHIGSKNGLMQMCTTIFARGSLFICA